MSLPLPDSDALAASHALQRQIAAEIAAGDGVMSFARFMELALYAPGLGYYSGGAAKLGQAGDFTTAPEISPLFGAALARVAAAIIAQSEPNILEFGAGTGKLAADVLRALWLLRDSHPALAWIIVGDGPERPALERLAAELGVSGRLHFTGQIPNAEAVATAVEAGGATYVDGGIIGPPPREPGTTRLYLSGDRAGEVARTFVDSRLEPVVVEAGRFAASATKMTYAAWTKVSAALLLSVHEAAERLDVDDVLRAEWAVSLPELAERLADAMR